MNRETLSEPLAVRFFPSCGEIGEGERSDAICVVQIMLNALKVRYDCYDFLECNASFDDATCDAIRRFRAMHAFAQTPGIDCETWNALVSEYNQLRESE